MPWPGKPPSHHWLTRFMLRRAMPVQHVKQNWKNVSLDPMDFAALTDFARAEDIALSIVGPEAPLVAGIVDYFKAKDLACFGPTQGAAQLEGSKAFSKDFLQRHNIPTAAYAVFSEEEQAIEYLKKPVHADCYQG